MLLGVGPEGPITGRRVAVTGLGAVTCCGLGVDALWEGLVHPTISGERRVTGFDAADYFGPKEARRVDRFAQFSVGAADGALADAGDLAADPDRSGVIFATGVGGFDTLAEQVTVYNERGARRVSPFLVPMMMANAGPAQISMRAGWRGPSENVVTACAAGTHAVAAAARLVASGRCEVAIGGGAEAAFHPVAVAAFANMTALSTSGESRPFDIRRDGFVMTEGAGAMVLEDWDRAVARGARIYAEIGGAGSTADAHHITAPAPDGAGAVACMEQALFDAQLQPSDVRHINAHGTSTPLNDLAEARAIGKVFGEPGPIVTSTKGVTGHGLGAAGAIEAVAAVLTIQHRLIPATYGCEQLDPEIHLDVVQGEARPWEPGPILSNSFGFGGHNGCLVILPPSD
ncbi:MAG TPA: beta-ketoacyl-ACP synthase II [Acidimicrobiales bacterium]|jgi:3-oxoacyl-[acyl-carrier-protein] synthase II|nr:beta-ketoacyl-ACP synthase II [Acidimicrobiales bacterium]